MALESHLPLSAVDELLQPSVRYLQVQDGIMLAGGIAWTAACVLYALQATRDQTYGMPLVPLCANIAWELLYGVLCPTSLGHPMIFAAWLLANIGVAATTLTYGPEQWKRSPLVADKLGVLLMVGCSVMLLMNIALAYDAPNVDEPALQSALICRALVSVASLAQLLCRGTTPGHSWGIWFCRWTGSLLFIALAFWRWNSYPDAYSIVAQPMTLLLFTVIEVADVVYALVYAEMEQQEEQYDEREKLRML